MSPWRARHLDDFAEMAGFGLVFIDETTTARGFGRELKWNNAYYRLAQGL